MNVKPPPAPSLYEYLKSGLIYPRRSQQVFANVIPLWRLIRLRLRATSMSCGATDTKRSRGLFEFPNLFSTNKQMRFLFTFHSESDANTLINTASAVRRGWNFVSNKDLDVCGNAYWGTFGGHLACLMCELIQN